MNQNKNNPAVKIWYIAYPFLFYYAVSIITMSLCRMVIGEDQSHYVACQLISTAVTIPVMLPMYRQDLALSGYETAHDWFTKEKLFHALFAIVIVACVSIAANNIISMTPLVTLSEGYHEANANFYGSTLALELISSALLTPIIEELVFRGILFGRLKTMLPKWPAIIVSSLIFAVVHYNLVQFLYAFLIGIVLALLMNRANHVYPAIVGHITANLIAVLRTELGLLQHTMDKSVFAWVVSIGLLVLGIIFIVYYLKIIKKHAK